MLRARWVGARGRPCPRPLSTLSATTPGSPTNLSGKSGNGQVTLTWQAPLSTGGSPITGYGVDYSSDGGTTWSTAIAPSAGGTALSYTVTGLTNGTAYVFRVAAANVNGTGSWSATSVGYTPQATVPGAPTGVTGSNATPTSIDVSWTQPASDGGSPILRNMVGMSGDNGVTWSYRMANVALPLVTTFKWTGLSPGVSYRFRVDAQSAVGWSPWSAMSPAVSTLP